MRRRLLLLACALAPALALSEEPPEPLDGPAAEAVTEAAPAPAAAAPAEPLPAPLAPAPPEAPYPRFGVALGLGVPQAVTLDLLYRPIPWIRLSAGPTWDYVGWGMHGGVVLSPFRWFVTPTLGVELGRLFETDLNDFADVDPGLQPLLQRVDLQYVATTLGVEIGSQRGFSFALRVGLVWLTASTHGTGRLTESGGISGQNDAIVTVTSPTIRASAPTAQLVFQYFI
jgi:hypothetical protein